jgi:hypothetical protein
MVTTKTLTQLACFATPRERVTAWAGATHQASGVSAIRMTGSTAAKGANGAGTPGYQAFEDPL